MSPPRLSRRTFLRGAGVAVSLPLLDAMLPSTAQAATQAPPKRLMAVYVPNGVIMDAWTPSQTGTGYTLSPILQPLAPVKSKVLVLTGLSNMPGDEADFDTGHQAPTTSFLTSQSPSESPLRSGPSFDQVAADALKSQTKLPSLELGTPDDGWVMWQQNISWAANNTPMPKEVNPRAVFDRLFAGYQPGTSDVEAQRRRFFRKSVLDAALADASALRSRVGVDDKRKLDEYLTSVREVERRVEAQSSRTCTPGTRPGLTDDPFTVLSLMLDLSVLAFQCDLTRVVTLMLDRAGSDLAYPQLGIQESHHVLSHEVDTPSVRTQVQAINTWCVQQLSGFLQKLDAVSESTGTLLDQCAIVYSSDLSDGDLHNKDNLPLLVAGSAGGQLVTGRHLRLASGTPRSNLYLSLLQTVGVNLAHFGDDSTGPLPTLFA